MRRWLSRQTTSRLPQSVLTIFTGIFLMVVAVLNGVSYVYIRRTVKKVEQAITEVQFPQN